MIDFSICVIRLWLTFDKGKPSWATGTIVDTNDGRLMLVTNRHVVTGQNVFPNFETRRAPVSISGELRLKNSPFNLWFKIHLLETNGKWLELENDVYSDRVFRKSYRYVDVAAIDLMEFANLEKPSEAWAIDLGSSYPNSHQESDENWGGMNVTDRCFVAGFPMEEGMTPNASLPIFKSGTIATEPRMDQLHYFLLDSPSVPGMSGSAVVHNPNMYIGIDGRLSTSHLQFVGIYSGSFLPPENQSVSGLRDFGLGIVWSINRTIRPLLAKKNM